MPKNPYFTQGSHQAEKDMLIDLAAEVISIHGINIEWIRNPYISVDNLYKEDRIPTLGQSKTIVVLVKDGFNGVQGEAVFSKFGFLNQQTIDIEIAVKEWKEVFGTNRPMEGDIFYIPTADEYGPADFFKVTYIDREQSTGWFPLGKHTVFNVTAEKWAYSSEDFDNTGNAEIDSQLPEWSNDVTINSDLQAEVSKVNSTVQTISDNYVDWSEKSPFGES